MDKYKIVVEVICAAGHHGELIPRQFTVWGRRHEVVELIDQWLATDHRYFKFKADDGATYILRHDTNLEEWELTFFSKQP